jgi:cell division protein ZipA
MDADILRLILIVLGVFLVLGIYFWERNRRIDSRVQAIRRDRQETRREPSMGDSDDEPDSADDDQDPSTRDAELKQALHELGDLVGEEQRPARQKRPSGEPKLTAEKPGREPAGTEQQDLFADDSLVETDHYRNADPSMPSMILQINIVARDKEGFEGPDIRRVTEGVDLKLGDMHIFHRSNSGGKGSVLFSMASMVEPGTFPPESMDEFRTPGLTLFAQLPGPKDGLAVFSDMLFSAERIAEDLNGELQDETHSRLTKQTIGHIRGQILEHRRKVQLARSKQTH